MKADEILKYCLDNLDGVNLVLSFGERNIFYNPENKLKRGVYVLTVKESDGKNDFSSNLNRENIYRVNIGIRKETFKGKFGFIPKRQKKGESTYMDYDFSVQNKIMPHPVYAWMGWICVINPSIETFEDLKPLIIESYEYAKEKYQKKE